VPPAFGQGRFCLRSDRLCSPACPLSRPAHHLMLVFRYAADPGLAIYLAACRTLPLLEERGFATLATVAEASMSVSTGTTSVAMHMRFVVLSPLFAHNSRMAVPR